MTTLIRKRLLATTIIAGAVMSAAPAFAQTDSSAADNAGGGVQGAGIPAPSTPDTTAEDTSDVIVTGSRIPHPNLESASPVTVLGAADVKQTGVTRVEDLINSLPQVFAGQGGNLSNGSTGTATIDLRGLGSNRTLVLINGRRVVPGDPASNDSAADVNLIPAALIKRVDVFTGGASSVYGADAVSGVVNFIMDTTFSGFRVDGQYAFYNHDNRVNGNVSQALGAKGYGAPNGLVTDGGSLDATVAFGAGFDDGHGHITAYASYRKIDAVLQGRRDYSACTLTAKSQAAAAVAGYGYTCGGSPTGFPANFYTGGGYVDNQGNATAPNLYNFGPTNYFQRPDERYTAGMFANYEVSEQFKPYLEFMFMDDLSVAQIAPSGDFFNTGQINCDNPLASPGLLAAGGCVGADGTTFDPTAGFANIYVARRNVEGGGRRDVLRHTTYRAVIGSKGDLFKGVSYDAYYQYGRVTSSDQQGNQLSISKLQNALNVVTGPDGTPQCQSAAARTAGCVPWNIFTPGGVTPAALAYLSIPTFSAGQNTEQVANASVTFRGGEYGFSSPFATEGLGLNVGVEYRKETNTQNYDVSFSSGDIAGAGSAPQPISGFFDVIEGFVEASLPLVQDKPFFNQLLLNGGYRRSHYEIGNKLSTFNTDTYKGEVIWQPVRDLRLRATYNRSVRAPNVGELFLAQQVQLDGSTDPCGYTTDAKGNRVAPEASQAACALTGLTAAQYGNVAANPANQYNGFVGGNPNLSPEKADSVTAGVVIQPTFLRGFNLTVDYFRIKIKNNIGQIGADTILTQCLATGDPAFCSLINRDANGSLFRTPQGFVVDTTLNQGSQKTDGVDVTVSYTQELGNYGSLGFNGSGTYLRSLTYNPVPGLEYNCSGLFGTQCGTPNPEWRHRASGTYTSPWGPALTLRWRYFSKVKDDALDNDPDLKSPISPTTGLPTASGTFPGNARINAYNYFDVALQAPIGDHFNMRVGANNIADRQPPINALGLGVVQNGNTFAQVYDALGRYVYAGITLDF